MAELLAGAEMEELQVAVAITASEAVGRRGGVWSWSSSRLRLG